MPDYLSRMTGNATPKDPEFSLKGTGARIKSDKADKRADQNRRHMEYWRRKNAHLCTKCGNQDARTLSGKVRCQACEDYHQMMKAGYREANKAAGKCIDCGMKLPPERIGKTRCTYCEAVCHA